jgi:hypothetical protein
MTSTKKNNKLKKLKRKKNLKRKKFFHLMIFTVNRKCLKNRTKKRNQKKWTFLNKRFLFKKNKKVILKIVLKK